MKIALIAPTEETVPPTKYGGTEWIVYDLAHGLGKKGHEVDLYAPGDSKKEEFYNLIPTVEKSLRHVPGLMSKLQLLDVTKIHSFSRIIPQLNKNIKEKQYDIVHNHASWRTLLFKPFIDHDIITTHHGPLSLDYQNIVFNDYIKQPHISISDNQRKDLPHLNFVATIYNGTEIKDFGYSEHVSADAPLAFLARISPEKGPVEAAITAQKTKKKLIIAAKVDRETDPYYKKFMTYVDNQYVTFHGEMDFNEKVKFLQNARCLLVPIQWEEPFGLMFTEAMACGTPVITFARGAAPEIVEDGKNGFLVNQSEEYIRGDWTFKKTGIEGLCEAVEKIYAMPEDEYRKLRQACRKRVEDHFTVERMVDNYEKMYQTLLSQ